MSPQSLCPMCGHDGFDEKLRDDAAIRLIVQRDALVLVLQTARDDLEQVQWQAHELARSTMAKVLSDLRAATA